MSKAFIRESDSEKDEELQQSPSISLGTHNYITPAGHARLKSELEELVKNERPKVVEIVSWAASNGDRSENGDYIYGKRRLREIDRRIRFLTQRLEISVVVDPLRQGNNDQVFFGACVTIADADGVESSYTIVGVDETDATHGRISWISPLARAVMKLRVGDVARFQSPSGIREVDIISVVYKAIE
ncbi:MAG: transcription elongation factor GreB [Betaproteobacteria bacterium HGW-Betaproteobacteria-10]|nr:MAG: transcription elongation factor GreB [Betaproteobacteria bacterium HGW-Betaproteobacteria-10]